MGSPDEPDEPGDRPPAEAEETRQVRRSGDSDRFDWRDFGGRDMPVAIASGVFLVVLFIGTILWHPAAFTAFITVLALIGVLETTRSLRKTGIGVAIPVVLTAAVVLLVGTYSARGPLGQAVGVAVLFLGAAIWELSDSGREQVLERIAATTLVGIWIPFLASYAILLVLRPVDGWLAVLATVGVAVLVDVGAFVVGTRMGRRKLAPSISPGKSWEGVAGGIGITALLALVLLPWMGTGELFTPLTAVIFAVIVGAAGILGDLIESMVKRDLDIKDFGGIIPGHGGVLDRVDSLLIALPTGYYVLAVVAG
jgi:phosphatidate cytidylyltransferase